MSEFHPIHRDRLPPSIEEWLPPTIWRASRERSSSNLIYDSLAFRYIAANTNPGRDTLCTFQTRFVGEIESLFVQVLGIARQMKLLKLVTVAVDRTKPRANASRPSALSTGLAEKLEAQRRETRLKAIARMRGLNLSQRTRGSAQYQQKE